MKKVLIAICLTLSFSAFANQDVTKSLETLKSSFSGEPQLKGTEMVASESTPGLYFGRRKVNNNFDIVDSVKKAHGGTATIFVLAGEEFVRISTNVLKSDGTRAIGTKLARNEAYKTVMSGKTFCGEVDILGSMYDTCYAPIQDSKGAILGIYYVGYKK